ncbi:MAG TPA: Gfo/Idh/MocA family oxidoreductase [Candidatus Saccharimonadales bacterium]|nr:Gfo/Idh/MocA family oxidoreductase [Candidatus Saccharimonadales bacterium]
MRPLVKEGSPIRLGMVGMVEGNGHPYSWSAIFNGFDPKAMAGCPYPVILEYLSRQPASAFGIGGARVTHVWCEDPKAARLVSQASLVPNVVTQATDLIGQVDAIMISTDKGEEHLERARPFVEAGLPVFIDKPLTDNEADLRQFVRWQRTGKAILSTSCMRYSREYAECRARIGAVGELRLITMTMSKSWERYGIHALEGVYPFLKPGGWREVANTGTDTANVVHAHHASGVEVVLAAISDMYGAFGCLNLYGTQGALSAKFDDTFFAFKTQLAQFIQYLRSGALPFPFDETIELMKIVIAGIRSRNESGRKVRLDEIQLD